MFWDKKKKDNLLPDLPPSSRPTLPTQRRLPDLPSYDLEKSETHQLPSFPDSPMKKGFSQAAIKEAVYGENNQEEESEREEYHPIEITQVEKQMMQMTPIRRAQEVKPVYVRLDKFQGAKKMLEEMSAMISESELLLKKIREVKMREEQELSAWEKEMQVLRARINNISTDIFERTEE
ncbi:MAG: hypothetical protein AABW79_04265 [Nanoarchaeota archaeon]